MKLNERNTRTRWNDTHAELGLDSARIQTSMKRGMDK